MCRIFLRSDISHLSYSRADTCYHHLRGCLARSTSIGTVTPLGRFHSTTILERRRLAIIVCSLDRVKKLAVIARTRHANDEEGSDLPNSISDPNRFVSVQVDSFKELHQKHPMRSTPRNFSGPPKLQAFKTLNARNSTCTLVARDACCSRLYFIDQRPGTWALT